jgi:hypothetical protein
MKGLQALCHPAFQPSRLLCHQGNQPPNLPLSHPRHRPANLALFIYEGIQAPCHLQFRQPFLPLSHPTNRPVNLPLSYPRNRPVTLPSHQKHLPYPRLSDQTSVCLSNRGYLCGKITVCVFYMDRDDNDIFPATARSVSIQKKKPIASTRQVSENLAKTNAHEQGKNHEMQLCLDNQNDVLRFNGTKTFYKFYTSEVSTKKMV